MHGNMNVKFLAVVNIINWSFNETYALPIFTNSVFKMSIHKEMNKMVDLRNITFREQLKKQ